MVALCINGIPISLHLDTQADVTVVIKRDYGKLQAKCILQPTSAAIRSYSGEGKGSPPPLLGKFAATLTREQKEIAEPVYVAKSRGDTALLSRHCTALRSQQRSPSRSTRAEFRKYL